MNTTYVVFSMIVGWCGTLWPGWWRGPRPTPQPDPWWRIAGISAIGGLVGGFLVTQVFPSEVSLVTISIGAFVGGRVLGNLYDIATMGREVQQLK